MTGNPSPTEQAALRRGMNEFADDRRGPGLAIPELLDQCRRIRRRHRATLAAATGVLAIAAVTSAVGLAQKQAPVRVTPAASATVRTGLPPLPLKPRAEDHTIQEANPLPQPPHPVIGTSYPFNWYAHCEMVYISFGGKIWKVDHPVEVPRMHPDFQGITHGPPIVPGYVTLTSPATLRFDAPTYITGVPLHPTTEKPIPCA